MAAMQVFSIPEILENILLEVAYLVEEDEIKKYSSLDKPHCSAPSLSESYQYRLEPTATLSTLRSTDRTFRATIEGSPKLQRALFANQSASLETLAIPPSVPLTWLLGHALGRDFKRDSAITYLRLGTNMVQSLRQISSFSKEDYGKHPEASWRQVKVHRGERKIDLVISWLSWRSRDCTTRYETIDIGSGTTLGAVSDKLTEILLSAARWIPDRKSRKKKPDYLPPDSDSEDETDWSSLIGAQVQRMT